MSTGRRHKDDIEKKVLDVQGWNVEDGLDLDKPPFRALLEKVVEQVAENIGEGLVNTITQSPPRMTFARLVDGDSGTDDVVLEIGLGISSGEWGPAWQFSLREEVEFARDGWPDEDRLVCAKALRSLADLLVEGLEDDDA